MSELETIPVDFQLEEQVEETKLSSQSCSVESLPSEHINGRNPAS